MENFKYKCAFCGKEFLNTGEIDSYRKSYINFKNQEIEKQKEKDFKEIKNLDLLLKKKLNDYASKYRVLCKIEFGDFGGIRKEMKWE